MSIKTDQAGCHRGKARSQVELDWVAGSGNCNGSIHTKTRLWGVSVKPQAGRLLAIPHRYRGHCRGRCLGQGHLNVLGADVVTVNAACLDDARVEALSWVPARYADGRRDHWHYAPAQTAHR